MRLTLVAAAVCETWAAAGPPSPPLASIRVDPATGHYVDSHGRTRIFHGVNVVYKQPPWYPRSDRFTATDSLDSQTMDDLREWGFNAVRLGVMWPGVEPEPGRVDEGYLDAIGQLARGLAERGIYTLADLHQDIGSRRFCGEGFPEHYVDALLADPGSRMAKASPFPAPIMAASELPLNASGFPRTSDCVRHQFVEYYDTYRAGALWEELYTHGSPLREGFLRFWRAVAGAFKDSPHVLAYELLNEPSGLCLKEGLLGCLSDVIPVAVGDSVEDGLLAPLYRAAAEAIRAAGAEQPILCEPTASPKLATQAFSAPPLGPEAQQGLAYHIYCAAGDGDGPVAGLLCDAAQAAYERTYYPFLQKHRGVAGFMTEFGAIGGNPGELKHLDRLLAAADAHFQSWAYWQLKKYGDFTTANAAESLYDEQGRLEVRKLKTLSRTYAPAIAGSPLHMAFDPATAAFELDFNATVVGEPTELYLNEPLYYPHGYRLAIEPQHCLSPGKRLQNRVELFLKDRACLGAVVKVRLTPEPAVLLSV